MYLISCFGVAYGRMETCSKEQFDIERHFHMLLDMRRLVDAGRLSRLWANNSCPSKSTVQCCSMLLLLLGYGQLRFIFRVSLGYSLQSCCCNTSTGMVLLHQMSRCLGLDPIIRGWAAEQEQWQ